MTEKTSPSSNIFLFHGDDDFSLRRKVEFWKSEFAKKFSASAVSVINAENLNETELTSRLKNELAPSLFSTKKLLIIRDSLPRKATQTVLCDFFLEFIPQIPKDYFVIFWEAQKPDGRLSFTKKFLSFVTNTEFNLPHGLELNQWIKAMAKNMQVSISDAAADRLAEYLGRDLGTEKKAGGRVIERKEAFDLWQVNSELQKLSAKTSRIESSDVSDLVRPKLPDSVFALTDEILAKNQKAAFTALENFLTSQTTDEKSAFVKIVALLSEQIRSLLVVSILAKQNLTNDAIAEKLGWSSGRVFIMTKHIKTQSQDKLKGLLNQLLLIDATLKSSDANSKLLIDLFITQAAN